MDRHTALEEPEVAVHGHDVVRRPAGGAAAPAADQLEGHAEGLRARELGALLSVRLSFELCRAAVRVGHRLHGAGADEGRALGVLIELAAGHTWLELLAGRRRP